jgi:hypothetical protein
MPNDDTATREALDTFIVSLQEIEKTTGYGFSDHLDKSVKAGASWGLDACDGIPKWHSNFHAPLKTRTCETESEIGSPKEQLPKPVNKQEQPVNIGFKCRQSSALSRHIGCPNLLQTTRICKILRHRIHTLP